MFNNNFIGALRRKRDDKLNRPTVRPEIGPIDWLLEAAALLGLLFFAGFVVYYFPKLPELIPSHFNGAGKPDEYAPKSTFWILPGIALFIYTLLSMMVLTPHRFNFSVKITPLNALKQYTLAIRLIRYLKAGLIWMFFYISYGTIRVAEKDGTGLGSWFLPVVLGGIFIPLIIYKINSSRNR